MEQGVNYYDTAWGYHNGNSELVMGKALARYPREKFYLANKFPGYDLSNMDKVEEIFEEQLEKCQVDYFDFYLFHNVCEMNIDAYLDPKYGIYGLSAGAEEKRAASATWAFPPTATTDGDEALPGGLRQGTWSSARSSSTTWTGTFQDAKAQGGAAGGVPTSPCG